VGKILPKQDEIKMGIPSMVSGENFKPQITRAGDRISQKDQQVVEKKDAIWGGE